MDSSHASAGVRNFRRRFPEAKSNENTGFSEIQQSGVKNSGKIADQSIDSQ
jgi:hypothetical protein